MSVVLIDLMFKAPFLPVPGLELQWSLTKQTNETVSSQEALTWSMETDTHANAYSLQPRGISARRLRGNEHMLDTDGQVYCHKSHLEALGLHQTSISAVFCQESHV